MSQRNDDRAKREKGYEALSPFELKDKLIEMASPDSERMTETAHGMLSGGHPETDM